MMSFQSIDAWWWPYVFIALAGWIATDIWRWAGVLAGSRLKDDSPLLVWVRSVATALVAAVIAKLVLYPSGELAGFPLMLRLGAAAIGFGVFLVAGKKPWIGILTAVLLLMGGKLIVDASGF